jgi:large subunit ribosomal protein L29
MAILKTKEIRNMGNDEREKKLKELKMELIKSKANTGKKGVNAKEVRKIIARIHTINTSDKEVLNK